MVNDAKVEVLINIKHKRPFEGHAQQNEETESDFGAAAALVTAPQQFLKSCSSETPRFPFLSHAAVGVISDHKRATEETINEAKVEH